jgi:hypothetical protein
VCSVIMRNGRGLIGWYGEIVGEATRRGKSVGCSLNRGVVGIRMRGQVGDKRRAAN